MILVSNCDCSSYSWTLLAGDFSAAGIPAIYDPATTAPNGKGGFTRQQFSCNGALNVICPDRISPISASFASLFPNPNRSGLTNNYVGTSTSYNRSNNYLLKIDQNIGSGSRVSVSYIYQNIPNGSVGAFGPTLSGSASVDTENRAIVNWDKSISNNKLNHVLLAFNRYSLFTRNGGQQSFSQGNSLDSKAGLKGEVDPAGESVLTLGGYYLGIGSEINDIAHSDAEIGDDFTWTHGGHELQFGFNTAYHFTIGIQADATNNFGAFTFAPQESGLPGDRSTGYAAASFLLGDVDSASWGQEPSQAFVMPYWAFYARDHWKIRHNLTLSYGLRWEYSPPITDRQDRIANFDPTLPNPGAGNRPGALVFAGKGVGRSGKSQFADSWYGGYGPRFGLAYSPSPSTVIRAAYGVMYQTNAAPAIFLNQQGFFTQATLDSLDGGVTPAFNWATGFPTVPLGPFFDPTFANGGSTASMQANGARMPMVQNWNFGVQRQLPGGIVADVSYVGSATHHLLNGNLNFNQLNPSFLGLGSLLDQQINSPAAVAAGIASPYAGFTGTVAQALRPYPQYQTITLTSDPVGNNTYHSLQVRAQKRLSRGISFLVSYTVSKDLTDADGYAGGAFLGGAQNYYNVRAEKSVAAADVPQALVAAYIYNLPIGKGQLLNFRRPVVNNILGGWTWSGIITLQSGTPLGISTEFSLPATGTVRPDVVSGAPFYSVNNRSSFDPATDRYLTDLPPG